MNDNGGHSYTEGMDYEKPANVFEQMRNELIYAHDAEEHLENAGGVHFAMTPQTKEAFQESRRLAWERIPHLRKAIELLTEHNRVQNSLPEPPHS